MTRDLLIARMAEMGNAPDFPRLAREVLGISGANEALARRLVAQALVVGDRRDEWKRLGARIVAAAPACPGVYIIHDAAGLPLYVGKAVNLKRRLASHFSDRRWRALKPEMARAAGAEWTEVGSELEALVREASLIRSLRPVVNVQQEIEPADRRDVPSALCRDVIVVVPSHDPEMATLVAARADGPSRLEQTRRNGADLGVHVRRLISFFRPGTAVAYDDDRSSAVVFSWLAGRGAGATRLYPHDARTVRELKARLAAIVGDASLFHERLDQRITL
jgi:predicted GIY-YIG superfamily endonuclease